MNNRESIGHKESLTNIVAKHLRPLAFDPAEPWSLEVANERQMARQEAQELIDRIRKKLGGSPKISVKTLRQHPRLRKLIEEAGDG